MTRISLSTGFHQKRFTALLCCMPGMYKDLCVCFLMTANFKGTHLLGWLIIWLLSAFSSLVTITLLGDAICWILAARKLNRSVLLPLSPKKLRQFEGPLHLLVSLRLAPCPPPPVLILIQPSVLMAGIHKTQCMFSHIWWNMSVLLGGRPTVHNLQTFLRFAVEECSLVLNHQWWWHQPVVHYQGV